MAERADICALAAAHAQHEASVRKRVHHVNRIHLRGTRLNLNFHALTRQIAQLLSVALERRKHRRLLHNVPDELRQHGFKLRRRCALAAACDDLSVRVLRIGRIAGLELRDIDFFLFHQIVKQARRLADHQRQHARRLGIQRSRMADLRAFGQTAAHAHDDVA